MRFNKSTNNELMSITENIQSSLDLGNYTRGVLTDLWKAFDTADHNILLKKIRALWWCKGKYEINGSGHTLKREHSLYLLETTHLILGKFWGLSEVH